MRGIRSRDIEEKEIVGHKRRENLHKRRGGSVVRLSWQRRQGLSFDTVRLAASSVAAVSHETDC